VSDDSKRRDAIADTARIVREAAAQGGTQITQTQAEQRVREAVTRGDRIRENGNR
jgi:hypothetical protein